jgi:hypothetical protein
MSGVILHSAHDRATARRLAVEAAGLARAHAPELHYTEGPERWEGIDRHLRAIRGEYPHHADCSAFVTWCLWTATRAWHLPDFVNGANWDGGYTGTLSTHGVRVGGPAVATGSLLLADVALYGPPTGPRAHTALVVHARHGVPYVVSNGSEAGPFLLPLRYRTDLREVRRFIR